MIPRLHFAHLPTPVEPMPRLAAELGGRVRLLVKRDDQTGLALGGNKTRKLEFLMAEAQANGAKMLISAGAGQSNHCRQVAAAAAHFGMDCILVLRGNPPEERNANLLLDDLLGAHVVWTGDANLQETLKATYALAQKNGQRPYLIPYGGSNATGALGYAFAFDELCAQGYQPDWIVMASSSGGTQAGLSLAARRAGFRGHVLGISIDHSVADLQKTVAALASDASERLGERIEFLPADIEVNDAFTGGGYGVMGALEVEAIRIFARTEGLLLDPVYTGRAAGGMLTLIRDGFFSRGSEVLFWHTGGTPGLFAEPYAKMLAG